jgi:hypothetical protein
MSTRAVINFIAAKVAVWRNARTLTKEEKKFESNMKSSPIQVKLNAKDLKLKYKFEKAKKLSYHGVRQLS